MKLVEKKFRNKNKFRALISEDLINTNDYSLKKTKGITDSKILHQETNLFFKTALQVIYQYHIYKRKIFVVGEKPLTKKKSFFAYKNRKHVFITNSSWEYGLFTNKKKKEKRKNFESQQIDFESDSINNLKYMKNPQITVLSNYWKSICAEFIKYEIPVVALHVLPASKKIYNTFTYQIPIVISSKAEKVERFFLALFEKLIKRKNFILGDQVIEVLKLDYDYPKKRKSFKSKPKKGYYYNNNRPPQRYPPYKKKQEQLNKQHTAVVAFNQNKSNAFFTPNPFSNSRNKNIIS